MPREGCQRIGRALKGRLNKIARRVLQTFVVHRETLHDVFPKALGGPDAELGAALRLHAVAHGNDDIEVVEPSRVVLPVGGSSKGFLYY